MGCPLPPALVKGPSSACRWGPVELPVEPTLPTNPDSDVFCGVACCCGAPELTAGVWVLGISSTGNAQSQTSWGLIVVGDPLWPRMKNLTNSGFSFVEVPISCEMVSLSLAFTFTEDSPVDSCSIGL